jgi:predicted  nucleic acid-binding Zn ribbon protein
MNCNLEVAPATLALSTELMQKMNIWWSIFDAIYRMWLTSGEFEEWAWAQLSDSANRLDQDGLALQRQLNLIRKCYYWYFQDQSAEGYEPPEVCPSCRAQLASYTEGTFLQLVCDVCSIVVPGQ